MFGATKYDGTVAFAVLYTTFPWCSAHCTVTCVHAPLCVRRPPTGQRPGPFDFQTGIDYPTSTIMSEL